MISDHPPLSRLEIVDMAAKREVPNAGDLINRYIAGAHVGQLLKEAGISGCLFDRLLRDAGIKRRSPQEAKALARGKPVVAARWTTDKLDELLADYCSGLSEKATAEKYGASRPVIRRILSENGIQPRGRSEAETLKWRTIKQNRAAVERQCGGAWAAARGRDDILETEVLALYRNSIASQSIIADMLGTTRSDVKRLIRKHGAANRRSERRAVGRAFCGGGPIVSKYELPLLYALQGHGLYPRHQHAIGPYNVDLAFPESRVAVEVERRPISDSKSLRRERVEYLFSAGWRLVIVYDPTAQGIAYRPVAQQLITALDILGRDPPPSGQYGVISRDGKVSTRSRHDLHGWPRIVGL